MTPPESSDATPLTERDHLFISYAGEDHVFSDWLSLRLAAAGYQVWYDRIKLLGGESYPRDIDLAIKGRAFRVIAVISRHSLNKPNPLKERTLAMDISRERGIDFLIPLNLDGLSPTELTWTLSDLTYIPFYKGWGAGLAQLLKKLNAEQAPTHPSVGLSRVSDWSRDEESATERPERVWSNQVPFNEVPSQIVQYRLLPKTDLESLSKDWVFYKQNATTVWSFAPPAQTVKGLQRKTSVDWRKPVYLLAVRPRSVVSRLIREYVIRLCLRKGMLINLRGDVYFPTGLLENDKVHFITYDGRKTYVRVVGDRTFRTTGGVKEVSRYHLAFSPRPSYRGQDTYLRLNVGVFLTGTTEEALPPAKAQRRRKALGKNWWNHEWLSRTLACAAWLCDGHEQTLLTESESGNLTLAGLPRTLISPGGIDERALEKFESSSEEEELEEEPGDEEPEGSAGA